MEIQSAVDNSPICENIANLTIADWSGKGILGSFTIGAGLVIFHQVSLVIPHQVGLVIFHRVGLAVRPFISRLERRFEIPLQRLFGRRHFDFRNSIIASSLSLFDTASVLSISWGVAAIAQLLSHQSVQTTHDALMLCSTSYASNIIALGALCTTSEHVRRHQYRLPTMVFSLGLCVSTTALASRKIEYGKFPMEVCLPFFTEYLPQMKKYFKVLTGVFWGDVFVMIVQLVLAFFSPTKPGNFGFRKLVQLGRAFRIWLSLIAEIVLVVMIVLINHHFIPEQKLRHQARGQLAEGHWTFGQIVAMLIWLPVFAELVFIFFVGTERGEEGSLPISLVAQRGPIRSDLERRQDGTELAERGILSERLRDSGSYPRVQQ